MPSWIPWIMRLGTLVIAACLLVCARATAAPEQLRVLSYNLNYANPDRAATMRAIADSGADVVLLQECDAGWKRALEGTFAKKYPNQRFHLAERAPGGIAVLSRLPIANDESIASPIDTWFPAERAVVHTSFGDVQILNVHLRPQVDGGNWVKGHFTTEPLRVREVEAYWPHLSRELPTIVAGDFNETPDSAALAFLGKHGLARVPLTGPHTWHYELLEMDLDHVLVDRSLTARDGKVLDAGTSDHRPVVVTITGRT